MSFKESLYGISPWLLLISIPLMVIIGHIYTVGSNTTKTDGKEYRTYDMGYEEGLSAGKEIGYDNGHDDGYILGYNEGYSDGESDGYHAGATYTCLYYGDVNRAFKSAKNGAAWYTFVDAYDEYIANIYDDNEARIYIIWALISTVVEENATDDEKELLKSTFGDELFSQNGITLSP